MSTRLLQQLARSYGVQAAYYDVQGRRRTASVESLLAALRALGAPVVRIEDAVSALRERRQELWRRPLEPVAAAWDSTPAVIEVRLPSQLLSGDLEGHLMLEDGESQNLSWHGPSLRTLGAAEVEGAPYVAAALPLPEGLPHGYHRLSIEAPGGPAESLVISAPPRAFGAPWDEKAWGIFLPLYALTTRRSWGCGDFHDLGALAEWAASLGGRVVATTPFLAAFLDDPFEPSPYAPASRLAWNELYVDPTKAPEFSRCAHARELLASAQVQGEIKALQSSPEVDYRRMAALKRRILERLARHCFSGAPGRQEELQHYLRANPAVEDYAAFRAVCERNRVPWSAWPQPLRGGAITTGNYDAAAKQYHAYVQFLADEQVRPLAEGASRKGAGLYLDMPLGVHPEGYDVWREQGLFALGASVGAPPDAFFTKGQEWRFPPMHPDRLREQGYRYYIACLRHQLRYAKVLRLDHVMGLHRLFWIPQGMEAKDGVYVRYQPHEFYAILALESHRASAMIVGEDLGTVPPEVRPAMARHGIHGMYVAQYEAKLDPRGALPKVPRRTVASLNTHDMPPFSAFWKGLDIQDRRDLGLMSGAGAAREQHRRERLKEALARFLKLSGAAPDGSVEAARALKALLAYLSASPASLVLVNLEDLWLESRPQNVPGTTKERPNWRRKAYLGLEEFMQMPDVLEALKEVNMARIQPEVR